MSALEELKKKIADIETQSLAMDGCRPTFTVSDIMDLIDSVEHAQNLHNACADGDYISKQAAIGALHTEIIKRRLLDDVNDGMLDEFDTESILRKLPSAQPETCKEKLKEIADALSEKFAYMNTCLNERDIILGYLGVERPSKIHCNTDCTNIKCEIHRCNKRLPSAQPEREWIPCSDPSDLPKDERLWITREIYGARIVYDVVWDMTEWSDDISDVVAYMPYWEPEPYTER